MNSFSLFGKKISGPFTIPSGVITTEVSIIERIGRTVPQIGILTTKSISRLPKAGNREPIFARYDGGKNSFVNAVGLTNPGAEEFARRLKTITLPEDKFLLISIFGGSAEDFLETAKILLPFADGFELNISCPHSKGFGQAIGEDLPLVKEIIQAVKTLKKPTVVKISPNVDVESTISICIDASADGIVAINTWGPKSQLHEGNPILTNKVGGASGQIIRDLGISSVKKVRSMTTMPIIACGGMREAEDVLQYKKAGANYFGIGSALFTMDTKNIQEYFHALEKDIQHHTHTVKRFLHSNSHFIYKKSFIKKKKRIDETIVTITLNDAISCKPGQYVFLWIPGVGEKPFSILDTDPAVIFIKIKGCFTEAIQQMKEGDTIYYRGPYGKPVQKKKGTTLIVGAGTGIAALYLIAKHNTQTVAFLGAKTKKQIVYLSQFKSVCNKILIATSQEKGIYKHVTDGLAKVIQQYKPTRCINCGPPQMVYDCIAIEEKYLKKENILSSIEFMTKCGVGICGSCATKKGYRNCVDGTFFLPDEL